MVQRLERCAAMPNGRLSRCDKPMLLVTSIYQALPWCKKSVRRIVAAFVWRLVSERTDMPGTMIDSLGLGPSPNGRSIERIPQKSVGLDRIENMAHFSILKRHADENAALRIVRHVASVDLDVGTVVGTQSS
ncbi:hypothetical protein Q3O94_21280 [Ralstonia pseudosolanacearum]|nr:hypothetical protein [Ralstonia pseudosolanacearum]MDO3563974.1 hypothetical protein [Ralstonia pseudosolanacearum]MDO3573600.1 hypothetical protein [Ralstonia pseudosolanacearum]